MLEGKLGNESLRTPEYLEGHGNLVSRLITSISHIIAPLSPLLTHLLSPHDPPSKPVLLPRSSAGDEENSVFKTQSHENGSAACLCQNLDSPRGDFPKFRVTFGGPNNKDYRIFEVFFGVLLSMEATTLRSRWMPSWVKKEAQPAESPKPQAS